MHDTFYFPGGKLLRTHTSPVQIRSMVKEGVPIRIIAPGRVYRCDSDQTHTPMFHQVEGLVIDRGRQLCQSEGRSAPVCRELFRAQGRTALSALVFSVHRASAEVDYPGAKGKWLEILGCGMVHPNVLEAPVSIAEKYTGYAFGMGIERLAMLRYGVKDLRTFFENDLRFLRQFR